ncbi:methyltransferase domain-containing protein [Novosphingobium sp.]|uniref:class I SAM-dependent methyltransferase n=1 Tax=Novosphingobium sp. TaxID=1874826 RepID=UPI00334149FD
MKHVLELPALYQFYQELGGFFGARVTAIRDYLELRPNARVIDIGCGPGYILRHLPATIDYVGLDIDEPSIAFARARFESRFFDADAARELGPADVVMMNGVMHHIGDDDLVATLGHVRNALKPGGVLFTLDGCYAPGQGRLEKWLLDNDRGLHVRRADEYRHLLEQAFPDVEMHVRNKLSRLPYTFAIGVAKAA